MKKLLYYAVFFVATLLQAKSEINVSFEKEVVTLRSHWAEVKYLASPEQKEVKFENLVLEAQNLVNTHPENAALSAWYGTILSSYAHFKGGLSALGKFKQARKVLEQSIQLDPRAEDGLAHAVLGALYCRVPSKPIGFRDLQKAKKHLLIALSIDPHNIDANFFYGEYLIKIGDEEAAQQYLLAALDAPVRKHQGVADNGRREEILNLLATIKR